MADNERYIGIVNIHGDWKIQESCEQENAREFVNSELQNAIKSFPHYEDFQGRILKVCEETVILPSNIVPNSPEVT